MVGRATQAGSADVAEGAPDWLAAEPLDAANSCFLEKLWAGTGVLRDPPTDLGRCELPEAMAGPLAALVAAIGDPALDESFDDVVVEALGRDEGSAIAGMQPTWITWTAWRLREAVFARAFSVDAGTWELVKYGTDQPLAKLVVPNSSRWELAITFAAGDHAPPFVPENWGSGIRHNRVYDAKTIDGDQTDAELCGDLEAACEQERTALADVHGLAVDAFTCTFIQHRLGTNRARYAPASNNPLPLYGPGAWKITHGLKRTVRGLLFVNPVQGCGGESGGQELLDLQAGRKLPLPPQKGGFEITAGTLKSAEGKVLERFCRDAADGPTPEQIYEASQYRRYVPDFRTTWWIESIGSTSCPR
jgi:hypothetical protein